MHNYALPVIDTVRYYNGTVPHWVTKIKLQAARLSISWQDSAYCLVILEWQEKFVQWYKYCHQSIKSASGKIVWKPHKVNWFHLEYSSSLWIAAEGNQYIYIL